MESEELKEELVNNTEAKQYRTRALAGEITEMPKSYAIITNTRYMNALTVIQNDTAYIQASIIYLFSLFNT